jgi:aminomethyltransferase
VHVALGAKIVPFAGYEMPVQYPTGITVEHKAVREACGMFDVSHMGEVIVRGPDAIRFVSSVTSNDVAALGIGQVQYSTLLRADGTIVDDLLVYRFPDHLMLVINASNREKDLAHLEAHRAGFDCTMTDISDETALLAIQGTGYTGELGFELYFDQAEATKVWAAVMATGKVTPAGLGCRDSLRLEAGMCLYGNELDDRTTPIEAGLTWLVRLGKAEPFLGKEVLIRQHQEGTDRKLVGFTFDERAIPRHGYPVIYGGVKVGEVCSGTMSPTLGIPVGTCYLPSAAAVEGATFVVEIRGKDVPARVVKLPFYKRPGKA